MQIYDGATVSVERLKDKYPNVMFPATSEGCVKGRLPRASATIQPYLTSGQKRNEIDRVKDPIFVLFYTFSQGIYPGSRKQTVKPFLNSQRAKQLSMVLEHATTYMGGGEGQIFIFHSDRKDTVICILQNELCYYVSKEQ